MSSKFTFSVAFDGDGYARIRVEQNGHFVGFVGFRPDLTLMGETLLRKGLPKERLIVWAREAVEREVRS